MLSHLNRTAIIFLFEIFLLSGRGLVAICATLSDGFLLWMLLNGYCMLPDNSFLFLRESLLEGGRDLNRKEENKG